MPVFKTEGLYPTVNLGAIYILVYMNSNYIIYISIILYLLQ